jgi:hypothetical protein
MVDTDSDGLNDLAERTLKTNPNVRTPSPLVLYTDTSDPDRFVRPGQTFAYTATVENKIEHTPGLFVLGGMTVTAPSVLGSGVYTRDYNLYQKEAASLPLAFTVGGGAGTGPLAIYNATVGRMHDGDLATYYKWDPAPSVYITTVSQPGVWPHRRRNESLVWLVCRCLGRGNDERQAQAGRERLFGGDGRSPQRCALRARLKPVCTGRCLRGQWPVSHHVEQHPLSQRAKHLPLDPLFEPVAVRQLVL